MPSSNYRPEEGNRYGKLTVVERSHVKKYYKGRRNTSAVVYWRCVCECGGEIVSQTGGLRSGKTTHCGCSMKKKPGYVPPARKAPGVAARNHLYKRYEGSARVRNIPFELTMAQFFEVGSKPCDYCGAPPEPFDNYGKNYGSVLFTGIDREDPNVNLGYILGNVAPCCSRCNYGKQDMTREEFLTWSARIHAHQNRA